MKTNREIKFRMWSSKVNKYFYGVEAFECLKQQYCFDNNIKHIGHDHTGDGMIFEQFTGFQDKEGKDIYEGDILINDGSGDHMLVMWSVPYSGHIAVDVSSHEYDSIYCTIHEGVYIVGNKNNNPELISKFKDKKI